MIDIKVNERVAFHQVPSSEIVEINDLMKRSLPDEVFVNVLEGFCGAKLKCKLFTDEGDLISYDGSHVTKIGASIYGRLIASAVND